MFLAQELLNAIFIKCTGGGDTYEVAGRVNRNLVLSTPLRLQARPPTLRVRLGPAQPLCACLSNPSPATARQHLKLLLPADANSSWVLALQLAPF